MALDALIESISKELEDKVTTNIESKLTSKVDATLKDLTAKVAEVATGADLRVKIGKLPTSTVKGAKHANLKQLIAIAANRVPVLLVGMAGTGKTHAAEQVSEALNIDFYAMSVGAQTSKSDLLGFIHAGGNYIPSMFRRAYEHGGVFLLDEIDAGNSNVLVQLNAALSNGYCAFPDKMVERHKDFVFIASANTYGQGASRQYVGRNQLDASTLDRFVTLDWNVDDKLESALATNKQWLEVVRAVRRYVDSEGIRALVTPRATIKGSALLDSGLTFNQTLQAVVLSSIAVDKQSYIKKVATEAWKDTPEEITPDPKALTSSLSTSTLQRGDKVRILDGSRVLAAPGWVGSMNSLVGKVMTIDSISPDGKVVKLYEDADHWAFGPEWLEKL